MEKEVFSSLVPKDGRENQRRIRPCLQSKETKQDHYVPLTIIPIRVTPLPSKHVYRYIDNTPAWKKRKENEVK